jgi:hypothetical protein
MLILHPIRVLVSIPYDSKQYRIMALSAWHYFQKYTGGVSLSTHQVTKSLSRRERYDMEKTNTYCAIECVSHLAAPRARGQQTRHCFL